MEETIVLHDFLKMLTKVTIETAINVEFDEHLGYEKHFVKPNDNRDKDTPQKRITDNGQIPLYVPRDCSSIFNLSSFLSKKSDSSLQVKLYAKGMTKNRLSADFLRPNI
ncbi:transposase [Vibrio harveyi]